MSNISRILSFFEECPGHLKTSKKDLSKRLQVSEEEITEAKQIRRDQNQPSITDLEEFCTERGIKQEQIAGVWHKNKEISVYEKFHQNVDFNPFEEVVEALKEYKEPTIARKHSYEERVAVVNLFDAHIDKLSLLSETEEQSDITRNIKYFLTSLYKIADILRLKSPERIIFPIGNDFWQTNDSNLTTKKGTDQKHQVSHNHKESFKLGIQVLKNAIQLLRNIAPVTIVPVKGNHDEDRVFYLTQLLSILYEDAQDVFIVDNTRQRNYVRYGDWLFGFAHGDKEKRKPQELPSLMSVERREDWAEIKQGLFFLGDIHHEKQYNALQTNDFRGCQVRFLRALSANDSWHYDQGYIGIPKTAYLFVFEKYGNQEEFKITL